MSLFNVEDLSLVYSKYKLGSGGVRVGAEKITWQSKERFRSSKSAETGKRRAGK